MEQTIKNTLAVNNKLSGEYRLVVTRLDGTQTDTGWFDNLILNQGLDRLGNGYTQTSYPGPPINGYTLSYCSVGTGTSVPAVTQTALDTPLAIRYLSYSNSATLAAPTYINQVLYISTFDQGAVVGNITEIGIGWDIAGGSTLFSRALISDGGGNPTTLSLLSIDQLTVYYRLNITSDLTDKTGSVDISGVSYTYTSRPSRVQYRAYNIMYGRVEAGQFARLKGFTAHPAGSVLGAITGEPTGSAQVASVGNSNLSIIESAYIIGTYTKSWTGNAGIAALNTTGGIQCLNVETYLGAQQFQFSPVIPKDSTKTISLTISSSWGR